MNSLTSKDIREKAEAYISDARNEMCRADEDVVPQLIFNNIRNAMELIFTSFLNQKGQQPTSEGLREMAKQCAGLDARFDKLRMDLIPREGNEQMRYINMDSLDNCVAVAEEAMDLLKQPAWPESKHVK